jgi:hypothetical protein
MYLVNLTQRLVLRYFGFMGHSKVANGSRYPLVGFDTAQPPGGTRQRHFDGTNCKPHKLLENVASPTTMAPALFAGDRVHAARCVSPLSVFIFHRISLIEHNPTRLKVLFAPTLGSKANCISYRPTSENVKREQTDKGDNSYKP